MKPEIKITKSSRRIPSAHQFRLSVLAVAIVLGGCATRDQSALFGGESVSRAPKTLGDLARRDIRLEAQSLEALPARQVIDTYREALSLFSTPEQRADALRRMADLTMVASEESLLASEPDPLASPDEDTGEDKAVNYTQAIALYQDQIKNAAADADLADTYYLLAKAYDLNAEPERALEALDAMVARHPTHALMEEVQFRRGEQYFVMEKYDQAIKAYQAVLTFGPKGSFYENALYKYGWSLYKQGEFELALGPFVTLLDTHLPPAATTAPANEAAKAGTVKTGDAPPRQDARARTRRQLEQDTLRVTALAFSHLDGADSIAAYFGDKGARHYENRIYSALAQQYVAQERYKDAADAYGAFIERHPQHPDAPALSSKKIEVFVKGGFPSLVLAEKQAFVQRYGIFSDYWKQATPARRQGYGDVLKLHLVELAQHYHSQAQTDKNPQAYRDAARWYREYLTTFPQDKNAPVMSALLGEVLFAAEDFQGAIEQFERTAYGDDTPENARQESAQKAAYFGLLSYQGLLKNMSRTDPARAGWITKEIASTLRFVKTWPQDTRVPTLMESVLESQLALSDMKGAQATADLIIKRIPPVPQALYEKAWMVQANAQFDEGNYVAAEASIKKILTFTSLSAAEQAIFKDRQATALYKQAERLEKEGLKAEAAKQYQKVAAAAPTSDVGAKADYDAANLLMETGQYEEAVKVLENFQRNFPSHTLAASVPAKLSVAYEKMGQHERSAQALEQVAALNADNAELALAALTQAAELHENKGNRREAIRLYAQLVAHKQLPFAQRVEWQYKLALLNEEDGNSAERDAWLAKVVESYQQGGSQNTARTRLLAAEASFRGAEPLFQRFVSLPLTQPLAQSIKQKKQAMDAVLKAYASTAEMGVLQFTTAATFRLGEAYRNFAKAILESERPTELAEDALEEYELLLEDQALPMEDKAIEILEANTTRVVEGAWDQWIQKSFDALANLQPGRYQKEELGEEYVDAIY